MMPRRQPAQTKTAHPQSLSPNLRQNPPKLRKAKTLRARPPPAPKLRQMAQQNRLMRRKKPRIAPRKTRLKTRPHPRSEAAKAGGRRRFNNRQCGVCAGYAYLKWPAPLIAASQLRRRARATSKLSQMAHSLV